MLALVRRLSKVMVPYAIVPINGETRFYRLDRERASHFRVLLAVNPLSELSSDELSTVRSLPGKLVLADEISDEMLATYSPFWETRNSKTRLIARSAKEGTKKIIIHVLRSIYQTNDALPIDCDHTVGLLPGPDITESINSAMWRSLRGVKRLHLSKSTTSVSVEIPDCEEWGLLEFSLG